MKKFQISVFFIIVHFVNVLAYDLEINGIYYNANINKMQLSVTNGEKTYAGIIKIPETADYKGKTFTVVEIGSGAFSGSNVENVTIPSTVTYIGSMAFNDCLSLKEVNFSEGLQTISNSAFFGCKALEEISIPSTVRSIYTLAFRNTGLKKLIFIDGGSDVELGAVGSSGGSGSSPFEGTPLEYVYIGRTIDFWNAKYGPFYDTNINKIDIGPLVESLPDYCFAGLNIKKLTIPSNVTKIGRSCLNCPSLEELTLSDGKEPLNWLLYSKIPNLKMLYYGRNLVVEQYNTAFNECNQIKTLYVGNYVSDFYKVYFNSNIETIYSFNPSPIDLLDSPFNAKTYLDAVVYVPFGSKEKYETTEGWKNFWEIKETDLSSVEKIGFTNSTSFKIVKDGIECINSDFFDIYDCHGVHVFHAYLKSGETLVLHPDLYIVCTSEHRMKVLIK